MSCYIKIVFLILIWVNQSYIYPQYLCNDDTRDASYHPAIGRVVNSSGQVLGSCWIAQNGKIVTAGHVIKTDPYTCKVQFNIYVNSPLPLPENIYKIVPDSYTGWYDENNPDEGDDWAVFEAVNDNDPGNIYTPIEIQNSYLKVNLDIDLTNANIAQIFGYGLDGDATPPNYGLLQQTAVGPKLTGSGPDKLTYQIYSINGCSGGPIIDVETGYAIGIGTAYQCNSNITKSMGTSIFNTGFWNSLGLEEYNVYADQQRENSTRLTSTSIDNWNPFSQSFETNTISDAPVHFILIENDELVLRGFQGLVQSPNEKYNQWKIFDDPSDDVTNHHKFIIENDQLQLTSQFKKTYTGITIKNSLEGTGVEGGSVEFKDPWFIDYPDPDYGNTLRNGGMDQATWRNRPSPFSPNASTSFENGKFYNGVFLNQEYDPNGQNPFYKVRSPITQDAPLTQTGKTHKFYFQSWNFSGTDPLTQNNIVNGFYESPVVFRNQSASVQANLKGTQLSNTSSAYSFNSQNKFLKTANGYLHNVYESMGNVWYEQSTDGGTTWTIMNNGLPVNYNDGSSNAKSPAISSSNDSNDPFIYITYQADNVWGHTGAYVILTQFYHGLPRWPLTQFVSDILPSYLYDTRPVVTGLNQFAMVVYKSASNAPLTAVEFKVNVSGDISQIIPRSFPSAYVSGNSILPSITNSGGIYHLAYQDAVFTIRYLRWFVYTNPLTSNYYSIPSAGSGYIFNTEPSISCANFNPVISWKGTQYDNTRAAVLRRGTLSGSNMIWSDFLKVGSSVNFVHSNSANNSTEKTVMSWSQEGSFTKWVKRTYPVNGGTQYSAPANLSHTGINTQLTNGTDYNNMKANIFRSAAPLYYFTQSTTDFSVNQDEGGGELNKITVDDTLVTFGRSGVADINGVEFIFEIGDILAGDSIIKFIDKPDTIVYASSYELNEFTRTKSFTLTPATDFYFTNIYYVVPKSEPDTALTNTDAVNFKVELVNANTNQVVGAFDNVTYNKNNLEKYASIDYSVDCSGITPGDYYLRLVTNVNCNANYALANIISDNTTLAKKNFNKVNFTGGEIPINYDLAQNFPNPFNPSTTIRYQIPQDGIVTLKIYDILGSEVATLVNEEKVAGKYEVNFSASSLASGVYIYKIQSGSFVNSKKMILLK